MENTRRFACQQEEAHNGAGQSFNAGDILLEIETDKAQMDVEAQDDGVLAKIVIPGGSQNIKVGKTIAMLAEHGDDLAAVEVPKEEDVQPPTELDVKTNEAQTSSAGSTTATSRERVKVTGSYTPAVLRLLQEFRIEDPSLITPTGPHGRILKGDVLAYTGSIGKQAPRTLNEILLKKQKLDLTNIKVQRTEASLAAPPISPPISKQALAPASLMRVVRITGLLRRQQKLSGIGL
jgi:pyruvate/2-oxoglutarate dehydrogenase complex dihydrolipoamide acyltransferase (E2) component